MDNPKEWTIKILDPTEDDPFHTVECKIIDIGWSDKILIIQKIEEK